MTERELPLVEGAVACPFVAFEHDRDSRASSPDHQHRCYAEVRPSPRALAHQQAYCLSSAFAVCPTFQDWARRESAEARSADSITPVGPDDEADGDGVEQLESSRGSGRNPPRDWASPPPWLGSSQGGPTDADGPEAADEADVQPIPSRGGGLVGSFADRIAAGALPPGPSPDDRPQLWQEPATRDIQSPNPDNAGPSSEPDGDDDDAEGPHADLVRPAPTRRGRATQRAGGDRVAPSWERPPRREAYPTLKTRMGLSGVAIPPLLVGLAALVIAAIVLFSLPALLGMGTPPSSAGPNSSVAASGTSASPSPVQSTPVPAPTAQTYVVQAGDTMSRIANRFGVPLQAMCDANKAAIPNCDNVAIGQTVIIPATAPTTVPGASPASSP